MAIGALYLNLDTSSSTPRSQSDLKLESKETKGNHEGPRGTKEDQGKPKETKRDQGKTKGQQERPRPRGTQRDQGGPRET